MAYTAAELKMVDDHIAQGERHIIQQEDLIARLKSHSLPTAEAELLLDEFRSTLALHLEHRNRILGIAPLG